MYALFPRPARRDLGKTSQDNTISEKSSRKCCITRRFCPGPFGEATIRVMAGLDTAIHVAPFAKSA
jgi:hypothetical protein